MYSAVLLWPVPRRYCNEKAELIIRQARRMVRYIKGKKGKSFTHSLPSVGPTGHTGTQPAVIHPAVGCDNFPPGLRLPSQPQSITAPWPVPSYTAWWQRHIGVNNLPKVITQRLPRVGFEPTDLLIASQRLIRCATAKILVKFPRDFSFGNWSRHFCRKRSQFHRPSLKRSHTA